MASHSIFRSPSCQQRWIDRITISLEKGIAIDISKIVVCVFQVPKTLSTDKPEAYEPQQIGLGPYHHFRPDLYKMEWKQIAAVNKFLRRANQALHSQHPVIRALKEHEFIIRAFYEKYLDFDGETLAWVVAIDALFLLHLLDTYPRQQVDYPRQQFYCAKRELARDIMMMEDQIPLTLLKAIWALQRQPSYDFEKEIEKSLQNSFVLKPHSPPLDEELLYGMLLAFCDQHSPLKLSEHFPFHYYNNSYHLLDLMYTLIVSNMRGEKVLMSAELFIGKATEQVLGMGGLRQIHMRGLRQIHMGGLRQIHNFLTFIINVPWKKIHALYRKGGDNPDNNKTPGKKIIIPSVSQLYAIGGVRFGLTTWGIGDIKFHEEELTFKLPLSTLCIDSEVILRNLVAYELKLASFNRLPTAVKLADYVDLMCGIIHTPKDVWLLMENGIIQGYGLSDVEIVDLFNEISKSNCTKLNETSYLQGTIDKVNKHYDNRLPVRVKACRFMKKCMYGLWKVVVFLSSIFLSLHLIYKAFCEVYDCRTFFHPKAPPNDLGFEMCPS